MKPKPIFFGQWPYVFIPRKYIPRKIQTEKGTFTIHENHSKITVELNRPEIIYTEQFVDQISAAIHISGKNLEINCGPQSFKSQFVAGELTSNEIMDRIRKQDGQNVKAEADIRRVRTGIFNFFGTKYVFVIFNNKEEMNSASTDCAEDVDDEVAWGTEDILVNEESLPMAIPLDENEGASSGNVIPDELDFVAISGGSKYSNAPILEIETSIINYIDDLEKLINEAQIVQIKRKDLFGKVEELGMFVEKDFDTGEIIIHLNGQDEVRFDEIFSPLVMQYLADNKTVLIECDICSLAEDIPAITNKISEGDIYDQIYEPISRLSGVEIYVQRREINPFTGEEKNYIVLEPRSV